jgi:hypothetical protein
VRLFLSIAKNRSWVLIGVRRNFFVLNAGRFRWHKYATGDDLAVERELGYATKPHRKKQTKTECAKLARSYTNGSLEMSG